jgi:hypothetical protein
MKTSFVKMLVLPIAAFALASAGAVTTNASRIDAAKKPPITAFAHSALPNSCEPQNVNCSTVVSANICMSSETSPRQVWLKDGTGACVVPLYKNN